MEYYRRNELPETVKRYKMYTDQFQVWLVKTAAQRGVEVAHFVEEQSKKVKSKKGKKGHKMSIEKQEQLVKAITATNHPLSDTSGLVDLGDAIRSRREVTQFHKLNHSADEGHAFFNENLESILASLKSLLPVMREEPKAKPPTFIYVRFSASSAMEDNSEAQLEAVQQQEDCQIHDDDRRPERPKPKKKPEDDSLTEEELELQRDFLVLCFLYGFNRIRGIVREVWLLYHNGNANAITAAQVTDLAQSHVQQNLTALIEELDASPGQLSQIIRNLYDKMSSPSSSSQQRTSPELPSGKALRHLFCLDATTLIKSYFVKDCPAAKLTGELAQPEHPLMLFLRYFDVFRKNAVTLPKWDTFTEEILLRPRSSRDLLPFGFQLIMDIQEVIRDDHRMLFKDVTEHGLDIARRMRLHVEYEDYMWSIGQKPDYICEGDIKFSTVFLQPLNSLLGWIRELTKTRDGATAKSGMTTDVFITVHSTLAGMSMWYYNRLYQATAISKIQWFIVGLAHLYNAARQVGGLELDWPDLDYVIGTHGLQRIFVGTPPKDPYDFLNRYYLASHISPRYMAADFRSGSGLAPRAPKETRTKRGLMPELPLEGKIREYYGPNKYERWMKRHNIFNYLHKQKQSSKKGSKQDSQAPSEELRRLQNIFASMATKISPPKSKIRSEKRTSPIRKPSFSQQEDTYAGLFRTMTSELQSHELHSNFDYLSFYRRTFDLILRIRNDVLFDDTEQIARAEKMGKNPDPDNYKLIIELFHSFKFEPEKEKKASTGQEVSTQVVPLDQLKRIADMMGDFIRQNGNAELVHARLRHERRWEELTASYVAEDAGKQAFSRQDDADIDQGDENVSEQDEQEDEDRPPLPVSDRCCDDEVVVDQVIDDVGISEDSHTNDDTQCGMFDKDNDEVGNSCSLNSQLGDQDVAGTTPRISRKRKASHMHGYDGNRDCATYEPDVESSLDATEDYEDILPTETDEELVAILPILDDNQVHPEPEHETSCEEEEVLLIESAAEDKAKHVTVKEHDPSPVSRLPHQAYVSEDDGTPQAHTVQVEVLPTPTELKATELISPTQERSVLADFSTHDTVDYNREDNLFRTLAPPPPPPKKKHNGRPKGFFHLFTYSSTTSRKLTVSTLRPATTSLPTTDHLTKHFRLCRLRRGLGIYHRLTSTASKHSVSFPCYATCIMSRNLHGRQTKLQRQMAVAVRVFREREKERRDSLELEKAWMAAVGGGESERSWGEEEDVD